MLEIKETIHGAYGETICSVVGVADESPRQNKKRELSLAIPSLFYNALFYKAEHLFRTRLISCQRDMCQGKM